MMIVLHESDFAMQLSRCPQGGALGTGHCLKQAASEPLGPTARKARLKSPLKGGDPAAPSGTATLLRLHPPYPPHLRRLRPLRVRPTASGADDSGGVTGGVYKTRERIHRGVLIRDY